MPLTVPPCDPIARRLYDGNALTREHRFVDFTDSVPDPSVEGHAGAGPYQYTVTRLHLGQRHRHGSVRSEQLGFFRCKVEQRPQRPGGAALRPRFHRLAEYDQRDHHRNRLIERPSAAGWKKSGCQQDGRRVEPGGAGAQSHQGVHVGGPPAGGGPAPDEEPPAHVQEDRQCEDARKPPCRTQNLGSRHRKSRDHLPVPDEHDRDAAGHADPEPTHEIPMFRLALLVAGALRFHRFPARFRNHFGRVADPLHGIQERGFRGRSRLHRHTGGFVNEVDLRFGDALHPREGAFNRGNARRAVHSPDAKPEFAARHPGRARFRRIHDIALRGTRVRRQERSHSSTSTSSAIALALRS